METKDPALTKTRIDDTEIRTDHTQVSSTQASSHDVIAGHDDTPKGTETFQETVIGTRYVSDDVEHGAHRHEDIHHDNHNVMSTDDDIESQTTTNNTAINKGTETFQETVVATEHVNDGDNPARQPDRRDQKGSAFDRGINEHSIGKIIS